MVLLFWFSFNLSGKIWQYLKLEPEPKLWTEVEPELELKINNSGSATLIKTYQCFGSGFRGLLDPDLDQRA